MDYCGELGSPSLHRRFVRHRADIDVHTGFKMLKAALSELFSEVRNPNTPIIVERIVSEIDEIVRHVRFPGWQDTKAGERDVQKALRKILHVKYKIKDQDLFDKAYGYIRQYY